MNNIIEMTVEEVQDSFELCLTLVERGHTIKIVQKGKPSCLMVAVPEYTSAYVQANDELPPDLPLPSDWKPDPVGVQEYVHEELRTMQEELNS